MLFYLYYSPSLFLLTPPSLSHPYHWPSSPLPLSLPPILLSPITVYLVVYTRPCIATSIEFTVWTKPFNMYAIIQNNFAGVQLGLFSSKCCVKQGLFKIKQERNCSIDNQQVLTNRGHLDCISEIRFTWWCKCLVIPIMIDKKFLLHEKHLPFGKPNPLMCTTPETVQPREGQFL